MPTPRIRRMASTAASSYAGEAESSFSETSAPSSARPITSVNVPPRSIQKAYRLSKT